MNAEICSRPRLLEAIKAHRQKDKTIVFTNGCFDLLHVGHVRYLADAAEQGDILVVGVNSDASVKAIKPDNRPIVPAAQRAEVLAALACVNYITIFDEPDPGELIAAIVPDVLVKGADWAEAGIIGADVVKNAGGRVQRVALAPGVSTTAIIKKILSLYNSP